MKYTTDNKLKIVSLTHDIKTMCNCIESTILKASGAFCPSSGVLHEMNNLSELIKRLDRIKNED